MDKKNLEEAEKEFQNLSRLYVQKEIQRERELVEKGLLVGLDGLNYLKDIQEWHREEVEKLKNKYGIN